MKHSTRLALLFFLLFAPALSARAQTAPEAVNLRGVVSDACKSAGRSPALTPALCDLGGVGRRHVSGDIFEYSFAVRVGEGEHDRITIHRVVREKRPGVPRKADRAVLMLHGDPGASTARFSAARSRAASRASSQSPPSWRAGTWTCGASTSAGRTSRRTRPTSRS